ncbi:hypothetical protein LCGC14_2260790 [marine sediment metagenome]|uniref:Uncharacterized protein n=1 Tax=marine sediment metagenome TaxID=412755 RepID=A0A0F9DM50_9ZZZZ
MRRLTYRSSMTRPVGAIGWEAIRTVREGGYIIFRGDKWREDALLPWVGQTVFLWTDGAFMNIYEGGFDGQNRVVAYWSKPICTLGE